MNPRSLTFQLIAWHAVILGGLALGFGIYTYLGLQHYLIDSLQLSQTRRANQIADTLVLHMDAFGENKLADQVATLQAPELNGRFIRISRDGKIIYASRTPNDGNFDPAQVKFYSNDNPPAERSESALNGNRIYISAVTASSGNGRRYTVEVGRDDSSVRSALHGLLVILALGFPVLILLVASSGYFTVQHSLSPVTKMMESAEKISIGNLSRRLPMAKTGDQLEKLSLSLNRMIDRLDEAFHQAIRFTADASHEIRTPLTVMRGELENLLENSALPRELHGDISIVLEEAERLSRITDGLLSISRLDSGEANVEQKRFDLGKLVALTAEQLQLLATEKQITLSVNTENVEIEGDSARIKQVIVNLLDNAIKYTPNGGNIEISISRKGDMAVLEVKDNGIGITEEELPHIFERFFRADKARSREEGGTGLGLAIVRSICVAHGGIIEAESIEGKGSKFTVNLPAMEYRI